MDDQEFKGKLGAGLEGRHSLPVGLILAGGTGPVAGGAKRKSSECFTAQEFDDRLVSAVDELLNGGPGNGASALKEPGVAGDDDDDDQDNGRHGADSRSMDQAPDSERSLQGEAYNADEPVTSELPATTGKAKPAPVIHIPAGDGTSASAAPFGKMRRSSPSRLLQKHKARQERAAEQRRKYALSRQTKIKAAGEKQEAVQKSRAEAHSKLVEEKKSRLISRMINASSNRDEELAAIKQRARADIQGVTEIRLIKSLSDNHQRLDIQYRQENTHQRRQELLSSLRRKQATQREKVATTIDRKRQLLQQKKEGQERRHQEASARKEEKLLRLRQHGTEKEKKREQVRHRRRKSEARALTVLDFLGEQSDNVWDLVELERPATQREQEFTVGGRVDLYALEKQRIREDAAFLDKIMSFDESGKVNVNIASEDDRLELGRMLRGNDFLETTQTSDSESANDLESAGGSRSSGLRYSRGGGTALWHQTSRQQSLNKAEKTPSPTREDQQPQKSTGARHSVGLRNPAKIVSDISSVPSADEIGNGDGLSLAEESKALPKSGEKPGGAVRASTLTAANLDEFNKQAEGPFGSALSNGKKPPSVDFDEEEQLMQIEARIDAAIRRNILREVMSEDLDWALCIKNDDDGLFERLRTAQLVQETRSLHSTPERAKEDARSGKSADERVFGSAGSRKGFKRTSRLGSRKSSISSRKSTTKHLKKLTKSRSRDLLQPFDSKSLQFLNSSHGHLDLHRDHSRDSFDSHRSWKASKHFYQTQGSRGLLDAQPHSEMIADAASVEQPSFGSQMNKLITNMKPPPSHSTPVNLLRGMSAKLTANAQRHLFPLREQMILVKRPGVDGQFVPARVIVKLEDFSQLANQSTKTKAETVDAPNEPVPATTEKPENANDTPPPKGTGLDTPKKPRLSNLESRNEANVSPKSLQPGPSPSSHAHNKENAGPIISPLPVTGSASRCAVKYLLTSAEATDLLKNEEQQNSIEVNDADPNEVKQIGSFLDQLEHEPLRFYYCRLCECILHEAPPAEDDKEVSESEEAPALSTLPMPAAVQATISQHLSGNKQHRSRREELGIKEIEDHCFGVLAFSSAPGDIAKELLKEKEKALKRKAKRLKVQLQQMAVPHENAGCQQAWKDYSALNKQTLQIRCLNLEKQVHPVIRDYDALESNLKEIHKVIQGKHQGDLMLFRKLRYIPTLIDICKRVLVVPRLEVKQVGRVIEWAVKIVSIFCTMRENKNYMLQTNRLVPLVDLLHWCLNRSTQLFYGIAFLPQLFQLLTVHLKHRCPYECTQAKEYLIELLVCSSIQSKIKNKLAAINYRLSIDQPAMPSPKSQKAPQEPMPPKPQVPLFLLKSLTFIEALTSIVSSDARYRPCYERNPKLGEHYLFVIENTELFGVVQMLATLLLTHSEAFKTSLPANAIDQDYFAVIEQSAEQTPSAVQAMPQTLLSISIVSVKVLNNCMRVDLKFAQHLLATNKLLSDQLYHLLNYLLVYSAEYYDKNEDSRELLHEALLLIGYFCHSSEEGQRLIQRGENTILQKLCNLPFPYFNDKKLKEILFPTLVQASYRNERCLAIMNQEISFDPLIKFLKDSMKEELPRIMEEEFDQQSVSSLGDFGGALGQKKLKRSTSDSSASLQLERISNGNCPYLPLVMRFPRNKWKDAIDFYESAE